MLNPDQFARAMGVQPIAGATTSSFLTPSRPRMFRKESNRNPALDPGPGQLPLPFDSEEKDSRFFDPSRGEPPKLPAPPETRFDFGLRG
jgi:hypothetical protein